VRAVIQLTHSKIAVPHRVHELKKVFYVLCVLCVLNPMLYPFYFICCAYVFNPYLYPYTHTHIPIYPYAYPYPYLIPISIKVPFLHERFTRPPRYVCMYVCILYVVLNPLHPYPYTHIPIYPYTHIPIYPYTHIPIYTRPPRRPRITTLKPNSNSVF
jgi:hypothetical protein